MTADWADEVARTLFVKLCSGPTKLVVPPKKTIDECESQIAAALRSAYTDGERAGINNAAVMTVKQANVFRDEASDQKQWGNREMHKRALAIAACFDSHASAIALRAPKEKP